MRSKSSPRPDDLTTAPPWRYSTTCIDHLTPEARASFQELLSNPLLMFRESCPFLFSHKDPPLRVARSKMPLRRPSSHHVFPPPDGAQSYSIRWAHSRLLRLQRSLPIFEVRRPTAATSMAASTLSSSELEATTARRKHTNARRSTKRQRHNLRPPLFFIHALS